MSTEMRKSERITQLIDEVKALGLGIRPPDINQPRSAFGVRDGEIVFGMGAVKGVGSAAIDVIAACRAELDRDFTDLFDLAEHVDLQKVNRKVLEGLINAGAMDRLPGHRRQLLDNLDRALAFGQQAARDRAGGQASLFGGSAAADALKPALQDCEPFDPLVKLSKERRAVGFFLSGHPFQEYGELIDSLTTGTAAGAHLRGEGTWVDLVGVITSHTKHRDRHKRVYARANFEDTSGVIGLTVYNQLYEESQNLVESDSILVVGGRVQVRSDGSREIVVDRMTRIDEVLGLWVQDIYLEIDLDRAGRSGLEGLAGLFEAFGQPTELHPLGQEEELPANGAAPAARAAADPGEEHDEDADDLGAPDPEMAPEPVLARPVPLIISVEREGKSWLLKSADRKIALTLESLRRLRRVPGGEKLRLRTMVPAPIERKKRFMGQG
jgi:DNA polymerase-3 subunit alpha